MRGPRWWVLVGCVGLSVLCAPAARAGGGGTIENGGTITFTGAILEPTCSFPTAQLVTAPGFHAQQQVCGGAGGGVANAARIYAVNVSQLSSDESDRVLKYFDNYVTAGQSSAQHPQLITQVYE
jgi:type 1 fimbria pilin